MSRENTGSDISGAVKLIAEQAKEQIKQNIKKKVIISVAPVAGKIFLIFLAVIIIVGMVIGVISTLTSPFKSIAHFFGSISNDIACTFITTCTSNPYSINVSINGVYPSPAYIPDWTVQTELTYMFNSVGGLPLNTYSINGAPLGQQIDNLFNQKFDLLQNTLNYCKSQANSITEIGYISQCMSSIIPASTLANYYSSAPLQPLMNNQIDQMNNRVKMVNGIPFFEIYYNLTDGNGNTDQGSTYIQPIGLTLTCFTEAQIDILYLNAHQNLANWAQLPYSYNSFACNYIGWAFDSMATYLTYCNPYFAYVYGAFGEQYNVPRNFCYPPTNNTIGYNMSVTPSTNDITTSYYGYDCSAFVTALAQLFGFFQSDSPGTWGHNRQTTYTIFDYDAISSSFSFNNLMSDNNNTQQLHSVIGALAGFSDNTPGYEIVDPYHVAFVHVGSNNNYVLYYGAQNTQNGFTVETASPGNNSQLTIIYWPWDLGNFSMGLLGNIS
jgi:hypothetical protein